MPTVTIPQAVEIAIQHHQAGRLAEAEAIYRQILAHDPRQSDALHLLGVIAHQVGRNDLAVDLIRQAIELSPNVPEFHSNLGEAYRKLGALDSAVAAYRRAIAIKPDYAEAQINIGVALSDQGRMSEAIAAYRKAIEVRPNYAEAHNNLGAALAQEGQIDEAIATYRRAIEIKPDYAEAHNNLGDALRRKCRFDEAIASCRTALALKPGLAEGHNNLGNALKENGQLEEAIAAYRRAIELKPDLAESHNNLGFTLRDQGRLDEAIAASRQAIQLRPDYAEAHNNIGTMLKERGQLEEAVAAYRRAGQIRPDYVIAHSNLLLGLHYLPDLDAPSLFQEHRLWDQIHAQPLARLIAPHGNDPNPERRLRVGYVSPDFREHSVTYFIENLLAGHDPDWVEAFCFSDVVRADPTTARLQQYAQHWRDITTMSDSQIAEMIRRDQIDILVDLAGHTAHNRLLVFARKPAPIQVTWLGYPNTTGMSAMDYRLTDAYADPPGTTEHLHSERLVRLPETFACFRPAEDSPAVGPLPAIERGYVTFASLHTQAKLNERVLAWWAGILRQVPDSRVLMVATGLDEISRQRSLIDFFGGKGVGPERLEFRGRQSLQQYLAIHNEVDVLLDTHPFTSHTISCHALWNGVPVVTLAGDRHYSRMVTSVLLNLSLPELIAQTPDEYVRIAGELAGNLPRLAELRSTLRERMQASPLTDGPRFTRHVEQAYREMWRAWCAKQS